MRIIEEIKAQILGGMNHVYNASHKGDTFEVSFVDDIENVILSGIDDFSPDEDSEIGDREITISDIEVKCYLGDRDVVLCDRTTGESVTYLIIEDVDDGYLVRGYHER